MSQILITLKENTLCLKSFFFKVVGSSSSCEVWPSIDDTMEKRDDFGKAATLEDSTNDGGGDEDAT